MKHTYTISGMTCNGCRAHVEHTFSNFKGISNATVSLENAEAVLEMETEVPLKKLQAAMKAEGGPYSIHELGTAIDEVAEPKKVEDGNGVFYCPMHC